MAVGKFKSRTRIKHKRGDGFARKTQRAETFLEADGKQEDTSQGRRLFRDSYLQHRGRQLAKLKNSFFRGRSKETVWKQRETRSRWGVRVKSRQKELNEEG